jgi:small-conductance mechanosensitive channel
MEYPTPIRLPSWLSPATITALAKLVFILVLTAAALRGLALLSNRLGKQLSRLETDEARLASMRTLLQVMRSAMVVLILALAIAEALLALDINITPLLAGAGVAGLAISLGAQSLIKDFISGTLILLENQYKVGEVVTVGAMSGTVERITLRATYLRDWTGALQIIPNGDIRALTNQSRDWATAVVDFSVAFGGDVSGVLRVLEKVASELKQDKNWKDLLLGEPEVRGWVGLVDSAVLVRLMARTRPSMRERLAIELRRRALEALKAQGVIAEASGDQNIRGVPGG